MNKRTTSVAALLRRQAGRTGTMLAALTAAAVTAGGIAVAMSGGGTVPVEHVSEMTFESTTTTTAADEQAATTTTGAAADRAELAATRAEVAADRSEKAAVRAEEVVTKATTTTTEPTVVPVTSTTVRWSEVPAPAEPPSSTTTTTVPVYGWADVLTIRANGSWDVALTGGPVRALDPKSTLKPMPLSPAGTLTLDDVGCAVQSGPDGDCLWGESPATGQHVVRLEGASRFSEPVVVQEYRRIS